MVIGIIGAGLSGLTAGRLLARAGHEVTVFEKSRGYGGRMATRYSGKNMETRLDHGLPYFEAEHPEFREFVVELLEKELVQPWGNNFSGFDGEKLYEKSPSEASGAIFTSANGMNQIGKHLARWVDVRNNTKVGGLTYFGKNRTKKRPWMINLTTSEAVNVDAVIIALPAPQAYGILSTTIDEINTLKIVRQIDEVHYKPAYSLMVGYKNAEVPRWEGIYCKNSILDFVSNEGLKRQGQECSFVLQASEAFTRQHHRNNSEDDVIVREMLTEFAMITGGWTSNPDWSNLHFWRYSRAKKIIDRPYFEHEDDGSPLVLVGDYFKGNKVENAYLSGYRLAKDWIEKYGD